MSEPQVRYLNLPQIPAYLLKDINELANKKEPSDRVFASYRWTSAYGTEIVDWCNKNISENLIWGFQIIDSDLTLHTDSPTRTKISYIFETGGDNVLTEFYQEFTMNTLLDSVKILPFKWHILNVGIPHRVRGIEPGRIRISLTGRIF